MNYLISSLDRFTLVSSSDAHSFYPWRLGREATIISFEGAFSYQYMVDALRKKE